MLSQILLSAALLATGVFSTPLHPDVSRALARGINLSAAIPSDATAIPGGFAFEYETEASAWVRAQLALGETSTQIGIGMFGVHDCGDGHGVWFPDVHYGARNTNITPDRYWSVGIAGRALKDGETLKFSQKGRGADNVRDYCATPIADAAPRAAVGCVNIPDINCFILASQWYGFLS